ncbi:hypothetical protein [Pseudomonas leptonychotis]|uniref:hypothetical protein n=1 Tax=Pseudomonas leptonychotis TaxID=2448482 RepID=UPI0039EE7886
MFLLFFSYVFGVAVEVLGEAQLFVRAFVLVFCIASSFFVRINFSLRSCILLTFVLVYSSVLYSINGGIIALNFIYLAVLLFYFYSLRVGRDEFLYYALASGFLVIVLYLVYLLVSGASLEPVVIGGRTRYYFGFTNPNKVGIVSYSFIVLSTLYFFGRNNALLCFVCIPFIVVAIYSDSRAALYAMALFAGLTCVPFLTLFRRLMFLIPIIFFIGSFYIASLNENYLVNVALSNRPIDFHDFISSLGVCDFLVGSSSDGYRVDNSYILAYFAIGPVGVLLFLFLLFRASHGGFSSLEFSFMVSIMAYGLMEGLLVRVEFPVVIYFYYLIFGRDNVVSRFGVTA